MSQIPDYNFTLITDNPLTSGLPVVGVDWISEGGGTAWVNTSEGAYFTAPSGGSQYLQKDLPAMQGGQLLDVIIQFRAITSCQINVSYKTSGGSPIYIHRRFVEGSPGFRILRFKHRTYDANPKGIAIEITNSSSVPQVTINFISVSEIDNLKRVIYPGNFKSISFQLQRSLELNGLLDIVQGSVDIYGEDLTWVLAIIEPSPSRVLKMSVEITSGVDSIMIPFVILDVLNIEITGDGTAYRANLSILRETEWSQFVSYYDENVDLTQTFDKLGYPTAQAQGLLEQAFPDASIGGQGPTLTQRFEGKAYSTGTIQLAADSELYIGFGDDVVRNDGFTPSSGITATQSLTIKTGQIYEVTGTVKVTYTRSNANLRVEAQLVAFGTWAEIASGVTNNINLIGNSANANPNAYSIRVRNASGVAQTISLNSGTNATVLNITTKVNYRFRPRGTQMWMLMKALLARVVGEYDNIEMPNLEDALPFSFTFEMGFDTVGQEFRNPPMQYYDTGLRQTGNYYIGQPNDWTKVVRGAPVNATVATVSVDAAGNCNMLLSRFHRSIPYSDGVNDGKFYTNYSTRAIYRTTINWDYANSSVGMTLDIYGFSGIDYELVTSVVFTGSSSTIIDLDLTARYYDSLGFRARGGGILGVVSIIGVVSDTVPYTRRGKNALNYLYNGLSSRTENPVIDDLLIRNSLKYLTGVDSRLFGQAVLPIVEAGSKLKLRLADITEVYQAAESTLLLYIQDYNVTVDNDLAFETVEAGGPYRDEERYDLEASCTQSTYVGTWQATRQKKDLTLSVTLNTNLIINRELSINDVYLLNIFQRPLPPSTDTAPRYRLTEELTIQGSESPLQFNWIHSESRIMRRNSFMLFAGRSRYFRLTDGFEGNQVFVDYPPDGFGLISDATLVTGEGGFTPYVCTSTTELTLAEFITFRNDRYKTFLVYANGALRFKAYIKDAVYNFATGKLNLQFWVKTFIS